MDGHEKNVLLPLSRDEAQELLARLLLSHDDDNDISAALMKRLALILEGNGGHAFSHAEPSPVALRIAA